jgi:hypothetical protein
LYPRFSKRAMISPTIPLWTPSGLTAKNVRSWLVPATPYTGRASHRVVLAANAIDPVAATPARASEKLL